MVLGILLGIGFGPLIAFLKPVGDILSRAAMLLVLPSSSS
jgi:Na+/H+-dicarboxylate symporter